MGWGERDGKGRMTDSTAPFLSSASSPNGLQLCIDECSFALKTKNSCLRAAVPRWVVSTCVCGHTDYVSDGKGRGRVEGRAVRGGVFV